MHVCVILFCILYLNVLARMQCARGAVRAYFERVGQQSCARAQHISRLLSDAPICRRPFDVWKNGTQKVVVVDFGPLQSARFTFVSIPYPASLTNGDTRGSRL